MDNNTESIRSNLENLKVTAGIMEPIAEFIETLLPEIDPDRSKVVNDDETVAIELFPLSKNGASVLFVFWHGNASRFEFFIEDQNVFATSFTGHDDVISLIKSMKLILSDTIERARIIRRNRVVKEIFTWSIYENGERRRVEVKTRVGWAFSLSPPKRIEHTFSPWIDEQ